VLHPVRALSLVGAHACRLVFFLDPRAIDPLRTIARDEPESMREAARLVERDIKDVSSNLERLAEYGIVEFVEEGRSKRPVVPFDDIEVRLPLRGDDGDAREQAGP